jgi:hypothetical protein
MTRGVVVMVFTVLVTLGARAEAQQDARAGLGGEFSTRQITIPKNSLALIAGPAQTPLFGQRYGGSSIDGGFAYHRHDTNSLVRSGGDQLWGRVGVAFGLWDNIEAGALFLTFRFTPDFAYSDFPVYITYSWTFDNVDIAARFSFITPAESGNWAIDPGLPVLVRLGHARIDTGVFLPVRFQDSTLVGLTIPARLIFNATPALFFGISSGFVVQNFDGPNKLSVPLGALAGYTLLAGARVFDITGSFDWDNFWLPDAPSGTDAVQPSSFRVLIGATMHNLVM